MADIFPGILFLLVPLVIVWYASRNIVDKKGRRRFSRNTGLVFVPIQLVVFGLILLTKLTWRDLNTDDVAGGLGAMIGAFVMWAAIAYGFASLRLRHLASMKKKQASVRRRKKRKSRQANSQTGTSSGRQPWYIAAVSIVASLVILAFAVLGAIGMALVRSGPKINTEAIVANVMCMQKIDNRAYCERIDRVATEGCIKLGGNRATCSCAARAMYGGFTEPVQVDFERLVAVAKASDC